MSIKSVLLTSADFEMLARMPLTTGSRPPFNAESERRTFSRLVALDLITGAEGCYSVRWGWLSVRQYDKVRFLRSQVTENIRLKGFGGGA